MSAKLGRILTRTDLESLTKILEDNGFVFKRKWPQYEHRQSAKSPAYYNPYMEQSSAGLHFSVHAYDLAEKHPSPQDRFPFSLILQYHELTHNLPLCAITLELDTFAQFQRDNKVNPISRIIEQLEEPVLAVPEKETFSLRKMTPDQYKLEDIQV